MKKNLIFLTVLSALLGAGIELQGMSQAEQLATIRRERALRYEQQQAAQQAQQLQQQIDQQRAEMAALGIEELTAQIREKESELRQFQDVQQHYQQEQPSGPRTRKNIQFSYEKAEEDVELAQSRLQPLLNKRQQYQALQAKTDSMSRELEALQPTEKAPAPAALPAAAAIEEEEEAAAPAKKSVFEQRPYLKPAIAATGAAVLITGALYAALKWHQRRRILRALRKQELNLTMLSTTQKDALAAAVMASYHVPTYMQKLSVLTRKANFSSSDVPAQKMWEMIAELYYRKAPTSAQIEKLKQQVSL